MNNSKNNDDLNNINVEDNVSDFAGIIESGYIKKIDKVIRNIENKTTIEIAVITVNSLGGRSIDKVALQLFNKFGVGKEDEDNGILLLISKEDKQNRIEIGRGLEAVMDDNFFHDLQEDFILPSFRNNKFGPGILKFVKIIADKVSEEIFRRFSIASLALGIAGIVSVPASFYAGILFNRLYEWELPLFMRDVFTGLIIGIPILALSISAVTCGINSLRRFKIRLYYEKSRSFKFSRLASIIGIILGSVSIICFLILYFLFFNNYIF